MGMPEDPSRGAAKRMGPEHRLSGLPMPCQAHIQHVAICQCIMQAYHVKVHCLQVVPSIARY